MKIAGQVAIVTGGGSGLGRAMALGLASKGAKVLLAEAREPEGRRVLEEIRSQGAIGEVFSGDSPAVTGKDHPRQRLERETTRSRLHGLTVGYSRKESLWRCPISCSLSSRKL